MRVISGTAKGIKLKSVEGMDTRPTLDRIKENLFNIIAPYVENSEVLDLFAGTGALGIEALSRGAKSCVFVDKQRKAFDIVLHNVRITKLENSARVFQKDWETFLRSNSQIFDLVFLDPPYSKDVEKKVLADIASSISEGGIVALECENEPFLSPCFEIIKNVQYGRVRLVIYRKIFSPNGS